MRKIEAELLDLPSYRESLADRISRAYFRRESGANKENTNPNDLRKEASQDGSHRNLSKQKIDH